MNLPETAPLPSVDEGVAVIVAAYNAADTIARAVKSALAEPEVREVIVVDDASTDETANRARATDDHSGRLKILVQDKNLGPSAARNRAIRESNAPWLCVLDADDFFLPGRIEGLLRFSDKADFIADDMWQVVENDIDGPRKNLLSENLTEPRMIRFAEFVLSNVTQAGRQRGELGFVKPLMRRNFLLANQMQYRENMRLGEDYELYARALIAGARFRLVPAQGYVSVIRANSLSGQHTEADLLNLRDCDHALQARPGLSTEDRQALRQHYLSVDCRLQWRLLINAVKKKDWSATLATFARPHPVPLYLLGQLANQLFLRTSRKITGRSQ